VDEEIGFAGDLLQQFLAWMLAIAGQHLLDIVHDQPFMRDAKEHHAVRGPMKRRDRRVVFIHRLDRSDEALLYHVSMCRSNVCRSPTWARIIPPKLCAMKKRGRCCS
jgi:hypothetical protein